MSPTRDGPCTVAEYEGLFSDRQVVIVTRTLAVDGLYYHEVEPLGGMDTEDVLDILHEARDMYLRNVVLLEDEEDQLNEGDE